MAADLVVTEFFDQGDKEKNLLKLQPQCLAKIDPLLKPLRDQVLDNRAHWEILDGQRLANTMARETPV
ncbi:hypothetical protein LSH36_397g01008 [Paralvinella palmiformis]|uniref:Uncharacterized protein n=1 Tax=Paralvinella palmiformis TaxID=53620 RepID=A0AAD9JE10_9ANNE|nr:hypothetical protein LSH36_397g01008 [Paralvinella palmiformis]